MITVTTLGPFSVSYGDMTVSETDNRTRKVWRLIKYLAASRGRTVGRDELIGVVGSDSNTNNLSSVKTMIHRCRATLDALHLPDGKRLILQKDGGYCWNTDLPQQIDIDEFDRYIAEAERALSRAERVGLLMSALSLYKGFFLDKDFDDIHDLASEILRYHMKYIGIFEECAEYLLDAGEFDRLSAVASDAIRTDPYQELFHYYLIKVCLGKEDHEKALYYYNRANKLFMEKFRINPSDRIRKLYRYIIKSAHSLQNSVDEAKEELSAFFDGETAVYCEHDTFGLICRSARNMTDKDGAMPRIAFFTLSPSDERAFPSEKQLQKASANLRAILSELLDRSSFYTRFSATGYMALLISRNAERVSAGIRSAFEESSSASIKLDIVCEELTDL